MDFIANSTTEMTTKKPLGSKLTTELSLVYNKSEKHEKYCGPCTPLSLLSSPEKYFEKVDCFTGAWNFFHKLNMPKQDIMTINQTHFAPHWIKNQVIQNSIYTIYCINKSKPPRNSLRFPTVKSGMQNGHCHPWSPFPLFIHWIQDFRSFNCLVLGFFWRTTQTNR